MIEISWFGSKDYRNANLNSVSESVKSKNSGIRLFEITMTPGARLKKGRKELGLTGKALAGLLGISPSLESEWESDKFEVRQPNAQAINLVTGLSWIWILRGTGPMMSEAPAWTHALPVTPQEKPVPMPAEALSQTAMGLAIAQCQAAGTAGNSEDLVRAFKDILARLQA